MEVMEVDFLLGGSQQFQWPAVWGCGTWPFSFEEVSHHGPAQLWTWHSPMSRAPALFFLLRLLRPGADPIVEPWLRSICEDGGGIDPRVLETPSLDRSFVLSFRSKLLSTLKSVVHGYIAP